MTSQTGTARSSALATVLITGFFIFALAHLGLMLADVELWAAVTKPLPALTLAVYALVAGRGGLLALALLFCAGADVALDLDNLFVVGVVLFGLAHICFIVLFVQRGARLRIPFALVYLALWAAVLWWLWSGLGDMRIQLAGYSLLVTAMAVMAAGLNWRTGLGGLLFVISDGLIAAGIAGKEILPQQGMWVMATYFAALFLLVTGLNHRRAR